MGLNQIGGVKMTRFEKANKLTDKDFKQIIGVEKPTYEAMLDELRTAYAKKHKKRGRHTKLSLEDQLFLSLKYWRQYITQLELSFEFEVGEATVHDTIVWVENTLVKSSKFNLPGKKALCEDNDIEIVLVDVTESSIERPKKNSVNGIQEKRNTIP